MKWYQKMFWRFLQGTFGIYLRIRYNVKVKIYDDYPEKPFIFLATHAHLTDPFIIGAVVPYTISYLANSEAAGGLRYVMGKLVGVIPKKKGVMDPKAVKETFRSLKKGDVVGIFAEGDRSWDGETDKLFDNVVRLIKKAKVSVQLVRLSGNYLSWPRWAMYKRKGKILAEFYTMKCEKIKSMSDDELLEEIKTRLYNNDVKNEDMQKIEFKGKKVAEGVRYLLWLCPECMSHDSLYGSDDSIICKSCGKTWKLNANLKVSPAGDFGVDTKDWFDWQIEHIDRIIQEAKDEDILTTANDIELFLPGVDNTYELYSSGNLELYKDKMTFLSDDEDKDDVVYDINDIKFYVDNFNKTFEFNYKDERHRIDFKGKNSNKWIHFFRHLQR